VANYSTGISVTFDGDTFAEVRSLSWSFGGNQGYGRGGTFMLSPGTLTMTVLSDSLIDPRDCGKYGRLRVSGGGTDLQAYAVYERISVVAQLNSVTLYSVTFSFYPVL
jgi:hypothetical protein